MEAASLGQHEGAGAGALAAAERGAAAKSTDTQTTEDEKLNGSNAAAEAGLANLAVLAEELPAPPPAYLVQYDSNGFPATLLDWRREPKDDHYTGR